MPTLDVLFNLAVLESGDPSSIREHEIDPGMLFDDGQKLFICIREFAKENGTLPTLDTLVRRTNIQVSKPEKIETVDVYAKEIRVRHLGNVLSRELTDVSRLLKTGDPVATFERLNIAMNAARAAAVRRHDRVVDAVSETRIQTRIDRYNYIKSLGGQIDGLSTPWPTISQRSMGWHGGEIIVFAAKEKVGKTMALVKCATHTWAEGHPVLFVEMEMPLQQVERRFDSIAGGFDYENLRSAKLGDMAEQKYFSWLNEMKGKAGFHLVDGTGVRSVEDIANMALDYKAKLVCVDGLYILARGGGDTQMWERTINVIADAKDYAKRTDLPWLMTTQLSGSAKTDALTATTNELGYAKAIGQWADSVFAFFMDNQLRLDNRRVMRTLAARDFVPVDILLNWDMTTMDFSELGILDGDRMRDVTASGDTGPPPPSAIVDRAAPLPPPAFTQQEIPF